VQPASREEETYSKKRTIKIENKAGPGITYAVCNTCTVELENLCKERAWGFYYLRAPLIAGMRLLAAWHGIDPRAYWVRSETCRGCVRLMKTALKEKSTIFRFLNNSINPVFDKLVERLVTKDELLEAKRYARAATHPVDT
jgi:hypothetical protein